MGVRILQLGVLLASAAISAGAATRYPVDFPMKLQNHATKKPLKLPAKKGYTYEVKEDLTDVAVLKIFNSYGKPLDGSYEVTAEDMKQLGKEINAGLKAANKAQAKLKCESCLTSEKSDRRPALDHPVPAEVKLPTKKEDFCKLYDEFREQGVPRAPLKQALQFYFRQLDEFGPHKITKPAIAIADLSQNSREKRFYVLDLLKGEIKRAKVSHAGGLKSAKYPGDPKRTDGMLAKCGTFAEEGLQRPGFYKFGNYLFSETGRKEGWTDLTEAANGVRLKGLTPKVNWGAEDDNMVAHEWKLNRDGDQRPMARTDGSLALVPGAGKPLLEQLEGGAMLYSYAPQCTEEMELVLAQVKDWDKFCGDEEATGRTADPEAEGSSFRLPASDSILNPWH